MYIVLWHSWYNFALKYIFLTKLRHNWVLFDENTNEAKEKKGVEEDRLIRVRGLVIKSQFIRGWHSWANKVNSC